MVVFHAYVVLFILIFFDFFGFEHCYFILIYIFIGYSYIVLSKGTTSPPFDLLSQIS